MEKRDDIGINRINKWRGGRASEIPKKGEGWQGTQAAAVWRRGNHRKVLRRGRRNRLEKEKGHPGVVKEKKYCQNLPEGKGKRRKEKREL